MMFARYQRARRTAVSLLGCVGVLLITACASKPVGAPAEAGALPRLTHSKQWLLDEQGRVVLMRGGNLHALNDQDSSGQTRHKGLWRDDTPRLMAEAGFNGVRLVIFQSELMPNPGEISQQYLQAIERTVEAHRAAGLYTLIDFHQDEYGPAVGVRGMPGWATFSDGHTRNRDVKFPNGYFTERAVQRAFDNFWTNHAVPQTGRGVQEHYLDGLVAVAKKFANDTSVFGIDVMNEPATGTPCSQPDPVGANCPQLEQQLLKPFYEKAGAALSAAAPHTLIFVEPFMLQGALGIEINTPTPGAPTLNGLSYHNYGPIKEFRDRTNDSALAHAIRSDSALLNTEWGFTNDAAELSRQAQDFDDRLISWLAWARGPFEEVVNPQVRSKQDRSLDDVLRAYARPYPRATAGTPKKLKFDPDAGTLELTYSTVSPSGKKTGGRLTTEVMMPPSNFPQGYTAQVENGRIVSPPNARTLVVVSDRSAKEVTVRAKRVGELPPLLAPPAELSSRSMLSDLLRDPRANAVLKRHLPKVLESPQLGLSTQTSLRAMQAYDHSLTDELLDRVDQELSGVAPGQGIKIAADAQRTLATWPSPKRPLSVDRKIGDLLTDVDGRKVMERWLPEVVSSEQLSYALDRTLRSIQPFMPTLTNEKLAQINAELEALQP